ncbi:ATP-binding protein [Alicyclobacillus sp. SO9]|uniref:ATP-binding protein n=1 Tax=Alicyclobacillus sp. SO9 TaxID=2665646 RepID=UPI0018E79484|nr:ATP-binding protein [Alicyclobacillus sp. SO9]QQE78396.1 ATP-binding protein [Alicyclobacillus sp. SO9]
MTHKPLHNLIGTIEPAKYTQQIHEDYRGNPLIEALPPIMSPEEVLRYMSNKPKFSEVEKELLPYLRLHCVMRLEDFLHPLNRHVNLEQDLSVLVRRGYLSRNPLTPNHARMMRHIALALRDPKVAEMELNKFKIPTSTASARSIVGLSGIGKSTAVERILMQYPQVILHETEHLRHTQVVWAKIDCPPDGSLRSLCLDFLQVFDDLFGTREAERLAPQHGITTSILLGKMKLTAFNHSLGILVIDEIQNLNQAASGGKEKMLNFFVELANTIGVPVLLIGNPSIEKTFHGELRDGRRFPAMPGWTRLKPKTKDWKLFLSNLWRYQWTRKFAPLNSQLEGVIYSETMGIPDLIVKLFAIAQIRAMTSGKEALDTHLLRNTAKEYFYHLHPVLTAIRTGKDLEKYPDIDQPIVIKDFVQEAVENLVEEGSIQTESDPEQEVIEWLIAVGHSEATAIRATSQTRDDDLNRWKREALKASDAMLDQANSMSGKAASGMVRLGQSADNLPVRKSTRKKNSSTSSNTPMINAVRKGKTDKMTPYASLVRAGFVADPVQFILSGELRAKDLPG